MNAGLKQTILELVPYYPRTIKGYQLRALLAAPIYDAIGVACSCLLWASTAHPEVLRRVLHEPVVREGFRGESLMSVLGRAAR